MTREEREEKINGIISHVAGFGKNQNEKSK